MKISTRGRYGIRLMLALALQYGSGTVPLKNMAKDQNISEKYYQSPDEIRPCQKLPWRAGRLCPEPPAGRNHRRRGAARAGRLAFASKLCGPSRLPEL